MSKKGKDKNKNNIVIDNSAYSKLLNRILQVNEKNCKDLKNEIEEIEDISSKISNIIISILIFFGTSIILEILADLGISNIITSSSIYLSSIITSIGTGIIINRKQNKELNIKNQQLLALKSINDYLESELKISKNNNNLLSNNQILNLEKIHIQNIENVLYNNVQLKFLYNSYLEEYQKNRVIIDSLKRLDSKQKEECLKDIYSQMNENFTKTNIDINDDKNLLTDNTSKKLLTADTINNLFSETPLSQDKDLPSHQTGISLNKDSYNIPAYNCNDNGNMYVNGDILPPKAQEELEKNNQFSKKYPN